MSKIKDPTPIPVTRTNRTAKLEIFFDDTGAVVSLIASRFTFSVSNGVTIARDFDKQLTLAAAELDATLLNKIDKIDQLIDAKDV